jgi:hypothetical protein
MEKFPESLEIAIWIVGSCWALAILVYLIGASTEWTLPIFIFGLLTGIAEWFVRRKSQ